MKQEMYESFYSQPIHNPYELPHVQAEAPFPVREFPHTNFRPSEIDGLMRHLPDNGPGPSDAGGAVQDASIIAAEKEEAPTADGYSSLSPNTMKPCNPYFPQGCQYTNALTKKPKPVQQLSYAEQDQEGLNLFTTKLAEQAVMGHPMTTFGRLPTSTRFGTPIYLELDSSIIRSSAPLRGQIPDSD
jgi:hypothetical protein